MFKRSRVASAALAVIGGVSAIGAYAQEPQRVEITGTRIFRADLYGTTPIYSVDLRRRHVRPEPGEPAQSRFRAVPGADQRAPCGGGHLDVDVG